MSIISYTKQVPADGNAKYMVVSWEGLANGDEGTPITLPQLADRSVQVEGVFDGGTVEIKGSIDGVNYHTLSDLRGSAITLTATRIKAISEIVRYIKPVVSGGAGTNISTHLLMRLP